MCGIAGIAALDGRPAAPPGSLEAMCATLVHRGPDDACLGDDPRVRIGMRRLAIIDLAGGRQPLLAEDGAVRVVFNGEIYNFRELREGLAARGHAFGSHSDGEVIPHLYEEHGDGFALHLDGMFAIALHDARRGRLVLVRDRVGIKPLYWALTPGALVFGSEPKAILASGLVRPELDVDALGQFVSWEYVPAPASLFRGIRKLPPSGMLTLDLATGRIAEREYWDLPPRDPGGRSPADWEEEIDARIRTAVRRQLVSDVPLGAFLSGGVDSSLVVAGMGGARTFSIAFDDPTYDESPWARRVAAHLGVSHRVETIRPRVDELFERLLPHLDDPIADVSIFPTFLVSRLAREEVTVSLSGDGGDELFGGYETFVAQGHATRWARVPGPVRALVGAVADRVPPRPAKKGLVNKVKRFVEGARLDPALGHARWRLFAGPAEREALFTPEALAAMPTPVEAHILALAARVADRGPVDRALYVDFRSYLPENCLAKVDRMSMACSLEARVPLLDHELVEAAFRVPEALKVRGGETKVLLKRLAARKVPRACVYRPKQGFSIPMKNWLARELRPVLEERLAPGVLRREGIFRADEVRRRVDEHLAGRANHAHVLWALLVFQDWRARWSA